MLVPLLPADVPRIENVGLQATSDPPIVAGSVRVRTAVGQRRREFGIRLALGARRGEIVRLVLRRGLVLFTSGAAIGLLAAAASARVLSTLLFNVTAFDPLSFGVATVVMLAVAVAACDLPARRAGRVDPSLALRAE